MLNLWNALKSNPIFVAAYSAFAGALASEIQDSLVSGKLDFTRTGMEKILLYAATTAFAAVVHLYKTPPAPKEIK